MGRSIDYEAAKTLLVESFVEAEKNFREHKRISIPETMAQLTDRLFVSRTQAYREGLLGCVVAHLIDPEIDIRYPVAEHDKNAFSGRSLDERVINPFLVDRAIPVSKNPYLSALRRGVLFVPGGAKGQKDSEAFDALVEVVGQILKSTRPGAYEYLLFLLGAFIDLREASNILLRKVARLSMEQ